MLEINGKIFSTKLLIILSILSSIPYVSAQQYCYTSGGLFGVIVFSAFITIIVIVLTFIIVWILWIKKLINLDFILKAIGLKTTGSNERDLESRKQSDFAFDNPYFEAEEEDHKKRPKHVIISVEGNESKNENEFNREINNKYNSKQIIDENSKNGETGKKRFFKSLTLSSVLTNAHNIIQKSPKNEIKKPMDDLYLNESPKRIEVDLIGRDFTGLGFSICGNMRDGIFVKDVLNRGPANETGKVKAGDKIVSVRVCFESMVFEDAVAILSYASPYNVNIELQKCTQYSTLERLNNSSNINRNLDTNTNKRLLHPLYRSHSLNDLTQIAKDMSLSEKSTSSVGKNVIQKIKSQILNTIKLKPFNTEEEDKEYNNIGIEDKELEFNSSDDMKEVTQKETMDSKQHSIDGKHLGEDVVDRSESNIEVKSDSLIEENQVIRKQTIPVVPAKRKGKAPQPPSDVLPQTAADETQPLSLESIDIETTAQVHNEDKQMSAEDLSPQTISSLETITSEEENDFSVPIKTITPQRVQSPTGKPKSSSMSDLTSESHKLQTSLLERAVSLDMNGQTLPEENLSHIHGHNLLVLNEQTTDSMPIINWSLDKHLKSDINSSESTLEDINLGNSDDMNVSQSLYEIEVKANDSLKFGNEVKVLNTFPEVMPMTSTPLKTSRKILSINSDLSLSSNESQKLDKTLTEIKEIDFQTESKDKKESIETKPKDTIELSAQELDGLMMSHKQFVQKQIKTNGLSSGVQKTDLTEPQFESLGFESWSYVSEEENPKPDETQKDSTLYTTALDISLDETTDNCQKTKKLPEVAGITLKKGQNEPIMSNTVIISTNNSLDSSFSSTSSSSPSK